MAQKPRLPSRSVRRLGWRPDLPDHRDARYENPRPQAALPKFTDLTPGMPPVYNQGDLGSCVAQAVAALVQYLMRRDWAGGADYTLARLFLYYNARLAEGTVGQDSGAQIRDGMRVAANLGCPPEELWPYVESRFKKPPPAAVYRAAAAHKIGRYLRVGQTHDDVCSVLAANAPVVFGITVYPSMMTDLVARTGVVPLPGGDEEPDGGHAVTIVGHDDSTRLYKFRNSWDKLWGDGGYGYIPYDYALNPDLADDLWTSGAVR